MTLKMYSVHDSKAELYTPPSCYRARGLALRHFGELVQDKETPYSKNPADYHIFEIGEWDDCEGTSKMYQCAINLGCALDFVDGQSPSLNENVSPIERAN